MRRPGEVTGMEDSRPAVFLDRDGTLNEQMGYINHVNRFRLLPGVTEAVRRLNEAGYWVLVVTNQSGVARGYFPLSLVHEVHERMDQAFAAAGARLDGIFFCPHHPSGEIAPFCLDCACRKPRTGMIEEAMARFPVDKSRSWVVGDRYTDIAFGKRAGMRTILVETGYGRGDLAYVLPRKGLWPDHVAPDLLGAVHWLLGKGRP